MIVPSRRWLVGAALLALVAPLALVWPTAGTVLVLADALWLILLIVDAFRSFGPQSPAPDVARMAPPAFSLGRSLPVRYRWQNGGVRPMTLQVRESLPAVLALDPPDERTIVLAPGGTLWEELRAVPQRRGRTWDRDGGGRSEGELHLRQRAPMGLAWRQRRLPLPWRVTVYPNLVAASLRSLPTQTQRRREAGLRAVRRLGEGRAFESLREWVPGDDTRTIDWKATAKRGKVMARQYEDERRQQVLIVIDAGRMLTAETEGRARLESVVDAALQLSHAAVEHDDNVGLMVFADEVQSYIAPARGQRALRAILDALANVQGKLVEPDYPGAFAYLAARNRKRALTVVFTDLIDRTASEALVAHLGSLRPRHLPLAVTLRDPALNRLAVSRPATTTAAFERAAAEELLQSREQALSDMRSHGVLVLDVLPSAAATAVVEQYQLLKRRALL